jgi:5-oxoprolinase (ATP-hydrolysing)
VRTSRSTRRSVQRRFAGLAAEVEAATGVRRTPEEIAQGCLAIADDNMANAIKKITVQRGIDVTTGGYTLVCFGGAGAQHACRVADLLAVRRVMVHPLASVLSAYGMGLAEVRTLRQRAVDRPLDDSLRPELEAAAGDLRRAVLDELAAQDVPASGRRRGPRPPALRRDRRRVGGPLGAPGRCARPSRRSTRAATASPVPGRGLVVEAVTVEGVGAMEAVDEAEARRAATGPPEPSAVAGLHQPRSSPAARDVRRAVFARGTPCRRPGCGPALVCGETTTVVVEPGWALEVTRRDDLVLERVEALPKRTALGTESDPILLEIFNNLFMTIAEQMGVTLQNTAYSVNVKERLDFSCAIFDPEAR